MGVDRGGLHVAVTQQFLHRPNVRAAFQQMGGERVAQGMRAHPDGKSEVGCRLFDGTLEVLLEQVLT
jgi:hypothetical protein